MSAREEILARVRAANAAALGSAARDLVGDVGEPALAQAPFSPTSGRDATNAGLVELFVDRLVDYRAVVHVVPAAEIGATATAVLADQQAASVVAPAGLPSAWLAAFDGEVVTDDHLSAAALDAIDAVVTTSAIGIAETGTIILDHGMGQGRRALTLVPDLHVCVVQAVDVMPDVPDAVAALGPRMRENAPPLTWISGPSATSDIELSRVEGVHGPRRLVVIIAT